MDTILVRERTEPASEWDEKTGWKAPLMQGRVVNESRSESTSVCLPPQSIHFQRRDRLQLPKTGFWQISEGFIATSILSEDGNLIPLGIWSMGDLLGYPLVSHASLDVESITQVTVSPIVAPNPELLLRQSLQQIKQTQILLTLRHGPVVQRIENLLIWLGERFGEVTDDGILINLRLTHQMMADFVGSTRVTVTRLLPQLQRKGVLVCGKGHTFYLSLSKIQYNKHTLAEMQSSDLSLMSSL